MKSKIKQHLVAAEFELVFKNLDYILNTSSEEYKTFMVIQARYYKLKQDFSKNIIRRDNYDNSLAQITNSLVELIYSLPENINEKNARLKSIIRDLDIDKERIGQLHMVNCNRQELADYFWTEFDSKTTSNSQFYFIPACPVQMPPSFAERMVWEVLSEELDEEAESLCVETYKNGLRLKIADFHIKNNLIRTQKAFKKYFCKRFHESDFDKLIQESLPQKGYHYIATIIQLEINEWKPFIPEFLEWILETFSTVTKDKGGIYLFFTVIYMKQFVDNPLNAAQKKILNNLRAIISSNEQSCTIIKGFTPVLKEDVEYWFRDIGERNTNNVQQAIEVLTEGLSVEKHQRFLNENKLDMVDVEELQKIVYQIVNE